MTTLGDLRLRPMDEADIAWFFNDSSSALGLRSNMGAQLEAIQARPGKNSGTKGVWKGGGQGDPDAEDRRVAAAERFRRIEERLEAMALPKRRVLQAYYGIGTVLSGPQQKRLSAYGSMAGLVVLLADRHKRGRKPLTDDVTASLRKGPEGAESRKRIGERMREAEVALVEACGAYQRACIEAAREKRVRREGQLGTHRDSRPHGF